MHSELNHGKCFKKMLKKKKSLKMQCGKHLTFRGWLKKQKSLIISISKQPEI